MTIIFQWYVCRMESYLTITRRARTPVITQYGQDSQLVSTVRC